MTVTSGIRLSTLLALLFLTGCSSTRREAAPPAPAAVAGPEIVPPAKPVVIPESPRTPARNWQPQYVATGIATGIMVEFSGVKKDKQLNATNAAIELTKSWTGADSTSATRTPTAGEYTIRLNSTINDMRQAFFRVPPGRYLFRQTRQWADTSYVSNVEVREGNYSIVTVRVFNPRTGRYSELSDTTGN